MSQGARSADMSSSRDVRGKRAGGSDGVGMVPPQGLHSVTAIHQWNLLFCSSGETDRLQPREAVVA
jgi:hypothetical protein